ncbi:MAG: hypothetical protein H0S79_17285 [Anaerolineaceae bacterium]|nr:hypothetical protein [Anaerolineaceae bacterium]
MKKLLLVAVLLILFGVLSACIPTEPKDILPYCKETYESDFPDYPPAFIGACVSFFQTEKPTAFVSLCGSPAFRADLNADLGSDIQTRQDCIALLKSLEE